MLARLDPSLFQTQIEQARANLLRAQADVERLKVALEDAQIKLTRARELSGKQLLAKSDLDAAESTARAAEAQVRSAEAQVTQAQASLSQNQVNLQHTVIEAPIDGLVISRNVDVGQTVAASMQAPTLFILAADLTKMQVVANLDESDVGRIRPAQRVTFHVDAYPADEFTGTVAQVRLQPIVQQNVVTYATVINVPNPDLRLKPGMTANVNVEIARRTNVLRVPNTALRFRPSNDMFAALGQTPPPAGGRGENAGAGRSRTAGSAATTPADPAKTPKTPTTKPPATPKVATATPAEGEGEGGAGGGRGGGGGRARMMERLQSLSPEERERILERMRARGFDPTAAAGAAAPAASPAGRGGTGRGAAPKAAEESLSQRNPQATTIDALFGPLPVVESVGRVWVSCRQPVEAAPRSPGDHRRAGDRAARRGTPFKKGPSWSRTSRPATKRRGRGDQRLPGFGQPQRFGGPGGGGAGGNRGAGGGGR